MMRYASGRFQEVRGLGIDGAGKAEISEIFLMPYHTISRNSIAFRAR